MEYLIDFTIDIPDGTPPSDVDLRSQAEADRVGVLATEGHVLRVWRPTPDDGRWQAPSELLGDLEGHRLRSFAVVSAQIHIDDSPAESIGHLRMFAGATLLATGLSILELPVRSAAVCAMQSGQCEVTMKFNSEQLMMMLVCALFYLITRLMQEGRRLAEENESFI